MKIYKVGGVIRDELLGFAPGELDTLLAESNDTGEGESFDEIEDTFSDFDSEGKYRNVSFLIKTLDLFLIVLLTLYLLISYYSLDNITILILY